jgi:hypothetical protein
MHRDRYLVANQIVVALELARVGPAVTKSSKVGNRKIARVPGKLRICLKWIGQWAA